MGIRKLEVGDNLYNNKKIYYNIPADYVPTDSVPIILGSQRLPWDYYGDNRAGIYTNSANGKLYLVYTEDGTSVGAGPKTGNGTLWVTIADLGRITYVNKEHPAYQYFTIDDENEIYGYKDSGAKQKALSETNTEGLRVLVSELYTEVGSISEVLATLTTPEEG